MSQGVGQAAADKMAALFILLKSGEIKDQKSKATKKSKISQKNNIKQKRTHLLQIMIHHQLM